MPVHYTNQESIRLRFKHFIMAEKKQLLLRIDMQLWNDLSQWAKDELRSLNGQIEYILRDAVRKHKRGKRNEDDGTR